MTSFLAILKIAAIVITVVGIAVTLYALNYAEIIRIPLLNKSSKDIKKVSQKKSTTVFSKKAAEMKYIFQIQDIRNGIIYLKNNLFATVVKLGSIDVRLFSEEEQNVIEDILIKTVIALPNPFKFIVLTTSVDTGNIIESIYANSIENDMPMTIKSLASETINYLENMMYNKSIYTRENYIVLFSTEKDVDKVYSELNRLAEFVISQMNGAKIKAEKLTSEQEIDFIFRFLNNKNHKPSNSIKSGAFSLYVDVPYIYYEESEGKANAEIEEK